MHLYYLPSKTWNGPGWRTYRRHAMRQVVDLESAGSTPEIVLACHRVVTPDVPSSGQPGWDDGRLLLFGRGEEGTFARMDYCPADRS